MRQGREKHRYFALSYRRPSLQKLQRLLVITTYALQITHICARTAVRPAKCWKSTARFLCAIYLDLWACQQNPARGTFYTHGLHLSSSLLLLASVQSSARACDRRLVSQNFVQSDQMFRSSREREFMEGETAQTPDPSLCTTQFSASPPGYGSVEIGSKLCCNAIIS